MPYGAFVKLEPGIEGLVHISEMCWTKRINHPKELVQIGDKIEVQVLNINKDKQEISLGMKQCQPNPWDKVAEKYPPGTIITGVVRNLTNYGAFIEIEEGIDGLLHVSDMSWVRKVGHPERGRAEGREGHLRGAQRRSGAQARRPGPQADGQRPVGRRHPRPLQARPEGQEARSPSSPTSACSSSWSRAWKACCTSPSWPTTRSRARRTWSRSATRSRSRCCASTPRTARSACPCGTWTTRRCPDEIPDMPIEGVEAEKADGGGEGRQGEGQGDEGKLRGGTGAAGPLFQLPGEGGEKSDE